MLVYPWWYQLVTQKKELHQNPSTIGYYIAYICLLSYYCLSRSKKLVAQCRFLPIFNGMMGVFTPNI